MPSRTTYLTSGDDLWPGPGDNNLGPDFVTGLGGNDTIFGGSAGDELRGFLGDDQLYGGAANDLLIGNAGDDTLVGGVGNDTLVGAKDADVLTGGAGSDRFVVKGADTITDLADQDTILVESADIRDALIASATDVGADVQLTSGTLSVLVEGYQAADVSADWFTII